MMSVPEHSLCSRIAKENSNNSFSSRIDGPFLSSVMAFRSIAGSVLRWDDLTLRGATNFADYGVVREEGDLKRLREQ